MTKPKPKPKPKKRAPKRKKLHLFHNPGSVGSKHTTLAVFEVIARGPGGVRLSFANGQWLTVSDEVLETYFKQVN